MDALCPEREPAPGSTFAVRFLGVRGSLPAPAAEFLHYGGNTACVAVSCCGEDVIFDAGSGLTSFALQDGPGTTSKRVHILLSHLHADHLIGLFGCSFLHDPSVEVHIYGRGWKGGSLRAQLGTLVGPPYWPVGLEDFHARVEVHELRPDMSFSLADGVTVRTLEGKHPNGSLLYRMEYAGRSLVYTLDCEMDQKMFRALSAFAHNADMVIWDASFVPGELIRGWGHSTWKEGIAFRQAAGVKKIFMSHYAREYTDEVLERQELLAGEEDSACYFAREGMEEFLL